MLKLKTVINYTLPVLTSTVYHHTLCYCRTRGVISERSTRKQPISPDSGNMCPCTTCTEIAKLDSVSGVQKFRNATTPAAVAKKVSLFISAAAAEEEERCFSVCRLYGQSVDGISQNRHGSKTRHNFTQVAGRTERLCVYKYR